MPISIEEFEKSTPPKTQLFSILEDHSEYAYSLGELRRMFVDDEQSYSGLYLFIDLSNHVHEGKIRARVMPDAYYFAANKLSKIQKEK